MDKNMQELKQQTIKALNLSGQQGIKRLFELLEQYSSSCQGSAARKQFQIIYISCLGLLEMQHDWKNLKKYIIEWDMVDKVGEQIVKRMRQRVAEDQDLRVQNQKGKKQYLIEEMDRLFEKYWQFNSPKKQAPNYEIIRQQYQNKLRKHQPIKQEQKISTKGVQIEFQQPKVKIQHKSQEVQKQSQKSRQSAFFKGGGRSLKLKIGGFGNDKKKTQTAITQNKKQINDIKVQNNQIKKYSQESNNQKEKDIHSHHINQAKQVDFTEVTPEQINYIAKPKLKVVKFQEKDQNKQKYSDDDFQLSAVRSRQVPYREKADHWDNKRLQDFDFQQYHNNRRQRNRILNNPHKVSQQNIDNSFMNFSDESRFVYRTNQKNKNISATKNTHNIQQDFQILGELNQQQLKSKQLDLITSTKKSFVFCEEKLAMIQPNVKAVNVIGEVYRKEGITPFQLLKLAIENM